MYNNEQTCSLQLSDSDSLTSIAGLVHVNDLNLTTQILVSPCDTSASASEQILSSAEREICSNATIGQPWKRYERTDFKQTYYFGWP